MHLENFLESKNLRVLQARTPLPQTSNRDPHTDLRVTIIDRTPLVLIGQEIACRKGDHKEEVTWETLTATIAIVEEEITVLTEDPGNHLHRTILEETRLAQFQKNSLPLRVSLLWNPNLILNSRSMPFLLGMGIQRAYGDGF